MSYTRREFGKLALAGLPAAALLETPLFGSSIFQAKPNSKFGTVQIGVITYSYRSMPDQSGEATLKYVLDSGISAIELMDASTERFAGAPQPPARNGGPGGPGAPGGGGRARGGAFAGGTAAAGAAAATPPPALEPGQPSFNGQPCAGGRGAARAGAPPAPAAGPAGAAAADAARRGGGRGQASPEQQAYQEALKTWRTSVSMDKFQALRKMYNDAGVTIYAYKTDALQKNLQTSDEELDYMFKVASTLGATHTTMELPNQGPDGTAMLKRMAQFAEKHKLYVAYHTHAQGSMTAFDEALAMSPWNMSNVDLGHFVAGGNKGGTPLQFLEKFHGRIASFHLKDRTLPEHCSLTLPFGEGDGQIKDILLLMKTNKWTFPASIELESLVPAGSDAVQEVKKSVEYCKAVLA